MSLNDDEVDAMRLKLLNRECLGHFMAVAGGIGGRCSGCRGSGGWYGESSVSAGIIIASKHVIIEILCCR